MAVNQLPTIRRIIDMLLNNPNCNDNDIRQMFYAFRRLTVLKKIPSVVFTYDAECIFYSDLNKYKDEMLRVNEFVRSKGITETIFRDPDNYATSRADYDYYYELKTAEQIAEEEAARKAKAKADAPQAE